MKSLFKLELKKALTNKMFILSTVIATAMAIGSFVQRYLYESKFYNFINSSNYNPSYEIDTIYNQWIGAEAGSSFYYVFYLLIPALAAFAYSWSYISEEKSGYLRQMTVKGKRGDYIFAKYMSVFISGSLVIFIALITNIILCATYFPFIKPDIYYDVYYGIGMQNALCDLFYSFPTVYLIFCVLLTSMYSGLFSVFAMVCSFYIKNKYVSVFIPFFLCILVTYINSTLGISYRLSPTSFLHFGATSGAKTYEIIIFGELIAGILLTFGISLYRGKKNDIF